MVKNKDAEYWDKSLFRDSIKETLDKETGFIIDDNILDYICDKIYIAIKKKKDFKLERVN